MRHSAFTLEYANRRGKRGVPSFQEMLVRVLKSGLTKDTAFFAPADAALPTAHGGMAGIPDIILIHCGRAFGLELEAWNGALSGEQRAAQLALRDAGMRVEVARDLHEALMHLRDMGIPLRTGKAEMFRHRRVA